MYARAFGYQGLTGLGAGVEDIIRQEADCPQQVSTAERDRIRDELNSYTGNYMGQNPTGPDGKPLGKGGHWHEGHPDVRAWLDDLMPRMIGLTQRPKLLRCSAEARNRAQRWVGTLRDTLSRIKTSGGATVIPLGGLTVRTYRMRDYHFRSFGRWGPAGAPAEKPPAVASATEGVPFDPTVGGAGGDPTKPAAPVVTTGGGAQGVVVPTADGGYAVVPSSGLPFSMQGSVAGVPTQYLVYGGLALLAWRMMK